MIFSVGVNLQNKIFGEKVFCTDVENITQDNCFFLATSAIPFFIAELAGNAKKIFLPNVTASAKCIGLWEKDIPLSLSFLSDSQSSHLTELEAMEWFSNKIQQDSRFENYNEGLKKKLVPQVLHRLQNKEKPIRTTFTLRRAGTDTTVHIFPAQRSQRITIVATLSGPLHHFLQRIHFHGTNILTEVGQWKILP